MNINNILKNQLFKKFLTVCVDTKLCVSNTSLINNVLLAIRCTYNTTDGICIFESNIIDPINSFG